MLVLTVANCFSNYCSEATTRKNEMSRYFFFLKECLVCHSDLLSLFSKCQARCSPGSREHKEKQHTLQVHKHICSGYEGSCHQYRLFFLLKQFLNSSRSRLALMFVDRSSCGCGSIGSFSWVQKLVFPHEYVASLPYLDQVASSSRVV